MGFTADIFEIKHFAVHDGDGIRTTIFFKGCPLRCIWCHNPEGLSRKSELAFYEDRCVGCGDCADVCQFGAHKTENGKHIYKRDLCIGCGRCAAECGGGALVFYGKEYTVDELVAIALQDKDFYDTTGGGVTLSGGECLLQADFCAELLKKLKESGINTAVDTSGAVPREALEKVMSCTDKFLYDLKAYDEEVHIRCTGSSNKQIIDNLKYIDECKKPVEIRFPLVPGYNDGEAEKTAEFLSALTSVAAVRILPYHFPGSKYAVLGMECGLPHIPKDDELISRCEKIFRGYGINVL